MATRGSHSGVDRVRVSKAATTEQMKVDEMQDSARGRVGTPAAVSRSAILPTWARRAKR